MDAMHVIQVTSEPEKYSYLKKEAANCPHDIFEASWDPHFPINHPPVHGIKGDLARTTLMNWEDHAGYFVGMFRQPEQRTISGFNDNHHDAFDVKDLADYGNRVAGCSVRMLNGISCGGGDGFQSPLFFWGDGVTAEVPHPVTTSMIDTAIWRLEKGFAWVGITEEWPLSVCLFHRMFGTACKKSHFENSRPGLHSGQKQQGMYDTTGLHGWTDPFDGPLYRRALSIFWNNTAKHHVTSQLCRNVICPEAAEQFT